MKTTRIPKCPALLIAAPGSGHGKTLITAALARYYGDKGMRVAVFKVGPDYLDPTILAHASKTPVYNLDLWMMGEQHCRQLLHQAALSADLILVECAMGLYDGMRNGCTAINNNSCATLSRLFSLPLLLVINAKGMAQSFGAVVNGMASYQTGINIAGVIANNVGSPYHSQLIANSVDDNIAFCGSMPRSVDLLIPSRHLGLLQATEIADLDKRLNYAADQINRNLCIQLPAAVPFPRPDIDTIAEFRNALRGVTIGIAKDSAFSFIYQANIELLESCGAQIEYFSPLADKNLPNVDSLWLPGGYPECFLPQLEANSALKQAIYRHFKANRPILAECGGMLYLTNAISDKQGENYVMVGALPAAVTMMEKCVSIGLQSVELKQGVVKGHSFHHTRMHTTLEAVAYHRKLRDHSEGEALYRLHATTASYTHWYFPSNPRAIIAIFKTPP